MRMFLTTGDIARQLGLPLHCVTYAVQRLRITEDARAGTYRLYRRERLSEILKQIESVGVGVRADTKNGEGKCHG